ncbi:hypothetical protein MUB24_18390 [Lederbergia sp. NSJ-179]|uniref:hypothetical protein n=1 Tax=Lederbergia sp. NSJ-179 TaxID=2931402 RepID=UPI001FD5912C|nr:hypothetical protein [Lederbergia sp. NSJ-179]MCJ7842812.1 hypothetical protein [Lederbergia sp. NSJ-179]
MTSCSQKTNDETDEPFIIVTFSLAGSDDVRNMFPRNYSIFENGKLVLYTEPERKLKIGRGAPVYETQLRKEEVEKLKQLIEQIIFGYLSDHGSVDGRFLYIPVNLTDESKKVGGLNPNDPKFIEIADYVFD